jgi:aldehyde dehydrogenase (NAD+)
MSNSGQICTATSRILVHSSIHSTFLSHFQSAIKTTSTLGDPFSPDTFQGPQVTKTQYDRVLSYIESGKSEGATLTTGGTASKSTAGGKGFFIEPTVFTDVKPNMTIYREEIFGPFVVVATFETEDEAVRMANDTTYGLGSAVFTRDVERAHRVAGRIEAGMVWVNSSNDSDFRVPFGGVKQSGVGRELGEEGLKAYSQVKAVHINLGMRL